MCPPSPFISWVSALDWQLLDLRLDLRSMLDHFLFVPSDVETEVPSGQLRRREPSHWRIDLIGKLTPEPYVSPGPRGIFAIERL